MHSGPYYNAAPPPPTHPPQQSTHSADFLGTRNTLYPSFSGLFTDSTTARHHRKHATLFKRKAYLIPSTDPGIQSIASNRQYHVSRIYNAMTRTDAAKDNPNSIAMRRWVHSAYYPSECVEAYAHKILDCLLEQAELGFRGWHHNDYAQDERKSEDEDKSVDCMGRLENVIRGLEGEKTICEDVMMSAAQIRMFINAPRAYARRKEANRVGNSKRGR
ncbi:hypothetical protein BCR34DRAFT_529231, partial [Clohesyomyces aquaticus]